MGGEGFVFAGKLCVFIVWVFGGCVGVLEPGGQTGGGGIFAVSIKVQLGFCCD